jgi:hypothetical protein
MANCASSFSCSTGEPIRAAHCCDMGATVEGSQSSQSFMTTNSFSVESFPTILTLRLAASDKNVTAHETKKIYCAQCGSKVRFNDKYCGNCAAKI